MWELLNFWAGAKWRYAVPWPRGPRIFEMPWLGYLGFPPFALESASFWNFALAVRERLSPAARWGAVAALLALSLLVFNGIDLRSVRSFAP